MSYGCIFCAIVKRKIPFHKVYEDEKNLAFLDIHPLGPGHTLVIPKAHISLVEGLPEEGRWYIVDGSIAFEHMVLEATSLGLGTCWMGRLYENLGETDERIKNVLRVPDHMRILAITPLGYPDETPGPTKRKNLDEIVHYERF